MDSIHCARQKAVKLLDELEQEFQLIERRRQGLGKPNLLYVKDLYACPSRVFLVISVLRGFHRHSCLRQAAFSERTLLRCV